MFLQLFQSVDARTTFCIIGVELGAGLADLRLEDGHLCVEVLGHLFHVLQAQAGVTDTGHQPAYLVDGLGCHILILAAPWYHHLPECLGEGHRIVVEQLLGKILVGACELIRVFPLWQQHTLHRESRQQQCLAVLDGCSLSGLVGVVDHAHLG